MRILKKILISFSLLLIASCQQSVTGQQDLTNQAEDNPKSTQQAEKQVDKKKLPFNGTIQFNQQEGGFYGIVTSDGKKILPVNLAKEYYQDGAIIQFSGEYKDVMTIQQWGKPFTIKEIKIIKPGKKSTSPEI